MLEAMRKKSGTWVVRILAVFLILSFAAWGIGDIFRGRAVKQNAATVGDIDITIQEFSNQYRREMDRLRAAIGPTFDAARARELGLPDRTLDSLVEGRLLDLETVSLDLAISDSQVRNVIFEEPSFRNVAGQFDPNIFARSLAANGLTEAAYVATVRAQLRRQQLTRTIVAGGGAPDIMARTIYKYRGERRIAEVLKVPNSVAPPVKEPDDAAITAFYAKNPALFTAPEYRAITMINLDPTEIAKDMAPSEQRIEEEYKARLGQLSIPERRTLKQILVQDKATADKAYAMLKEGRSFDAVAKDVAGGNETETNLGRLTKRDVVPQIADKVFALPEGSFSEPLQSPFGWHIVLAEKVEPGKTPTLKEVRGVIRRDLALELAVDSLVRTANQLEDELAGGAKLEEAARTLNLPLVTISAIDSKGLDQKGKKVTGVPADAKFLDTVFSAEVNQQSQLIETRNGGYFILRVDRIIAPAVRPLDTVRDQVVQAVKAQGRDTAVKDYAEALLAKAKSGTSLKQIADAEKGVAVQTSQPFTRFATGDTGAVPATLVAPLFKASRGDTILAAYDGGYAVAKLTEIQTPTIDDPGEIEGVKKQIISAMSEDLLAQFSAALKVRYPVEINRDAIESVIQ